MMAAQIMITKSISLDDISRGKVAPIDVYQSQVRDWLFEPARILANALPRDPFCGMAIFALELMFFEPHGKLLIGYDEQNRSRATFSKGFDEFRVFLRDKNEIPPDSDTLSTSNIYGWARCGLFHSSIPREQILVDAECTNERCFSRNLPLDGWLVDPWRLLDQLDEYLSSYVKKVKDEPESSVSENFSTMFCQLSEGVIRKLQSRLDAMRGEEA